MVFHAQNDRITALLTRMVIGQVVVRMKVGFVQLFTSIRFRAACKIKHMQALHDREFMAKPERNGYDVPPCVDNVLSALFDVFMNRFYP